MLEKENPGILRTDRVGSRYMSRGQVEAGLTARRLEMAGMAQVARETGVRTAHGPRPTAHGPRPTVNTTLIAS